MATEAQINANRKNTRKSTGPRTAKGKAAASKNAVKHGLFASDNVVSCEKQADFDHFRAEWLAELAPVGLVELMLTERIVSLSWRLKRAERMHTQAVDRLIEYRITDPLAKSVQFLKCEAQGIPLGDPRWTTTHLQLGRVATHDWSNCRVLERLFMYEQRIERSLFKNLAELERLRLLRELRAQDADEEPAIPKASGFEAATQSSSSPSDEAATRSSPSLPDEAATRSPAGDEELAIPKASGLEAATRSKHTDLQGCDLKKRTQFPPGKVNVSSFAARDYENKPRRGLRENKPKQTQMPAIGAKSEGPSTKILKDSNRRETPVPQAHLTEHDFKKQTQFAAGQTDAKSFGNKGYENKSRRRLREKKPKQSQTPAFGRKLEALSTKSETSRLERAQSSKTNPISESEGRRQNTEGRVEVL